MKSRLLVIPVAMVAAFGLPCISSVTAGVHFKGPAIDFGLPPPRATMYAREYGSRSANAIWRPGTQYGIGGWSWSIDRRMTWEEEEQETKRKENADRRTLRRSRNLEAAGLLAQAKALYQGLGDSGNFTKTRIELFSQAGIEHAKGLDAYLKATHPLGGKAPLPAEAAVASVLKPWVAYSHASTASQYLGVANRYPGSSRAPVALIMAGRLLTQSDKPAVADLQRADHAFRVLLAKYPKSRFAWDAKGGLARIDYLRGRLDSAVKRYEEQFRQAATAEQKTNALASVSFCARAAHNRVAQAFTYLRMYDANLDGGQPFPFETMMVFTIEKFSGAEARGFWKRLQNDPAMLATYCEWRATNAEPNGDLEKLAKPAMKLAAGTPYEGRIAGSLARVALEHGNVKKATTYARIARRAPGADERALGTYILALADRRAGRFRAAQEGFQAIVREYPESYLVGGARETLAIVSERLGDFGTAMDQYVALDYGEDIAYLSDVRMTPAQLAAYVESHPKRNDLRYTLAMRYLRKGEWSAAESTLRPLSWRQRYDLTYGKNSDYVNPDDGKLQDPLVTVRELRKFDRAVQQAQGPRAKAVALSAMGDYYYAHKCLLLYSRPAWKGSRDGNVSFSWNGKVATQQDDAALKLHYDEHECYSQALKRYREVVRLYPKSKVAGHAAYMAAVAAERLSNMAPYWRWRERGDDRQGEAVQMMAFAMKSSDPTIRKKATKYRGVFSKERFATRTAFANEKAPTRKWMWDEE